MIRVLFVIDTYRIGGPGKGLLDFLGTCRGEVKALVLAFQRGIEGTTEFQDACARRQVPFQALQERHRFDPSLISRAATIAGAFRPDILQTHGYKADVIGWILHRRYRLPWIAFSHGWTSEGPRMRLYKLLDDHIIRSADRVVAVSEAQRVRLSTAGIASGGLVTIPNATQSGEEESEHPFVARTQLGLKPSGYLVGVVGRLSPEKGHTYFIDAMAQVARSVPEVQGIIVGDGPESTSLRARIKHLGLGEIVHCLGYRQDMARIYSALDLLVLPSLSEGLPNVALEAQERGCPVVGTRVGGVPEAVVDGVTGLLVPPATTAPLAEAIIRLLFDTSLRSAMGQAGRELIKQRFSPQARGERLLKLYREVLGRAPSRISLGASG